MPINISNISTHAKSNASQANKTNEQKSVNTIQNSDVKANATLEQDSVNLTSSATQIKSLEAQVARLPIVDIQKVEEVKNSLNDGTFEFNSVRIAEKLINFEKGLF